VKLNYRIEEPEEPKRFNIKTKISKLNPDKIPNLISEKNLEIIQDGDEDPYYKTQEIDILEKANGVLYTKEFWKTYLSKMEDHPIPGSKDGHHITWAKRPPTDLFLIGGKLIKNIVYLKNYIPKQGNNTSNETFIKEAKAGMIHFSIVSYTKDKIFLDADGFITDIHAIESVKGERNDAVEVGLGAMAQKTNTDNKETLIKTVEDLNAQAESDDDKSVYKIILQQLNHKPTKSNKGDNRFMELDEIFEKLNNMKVNGELNILDFCSKLKIEVVNDTHRNAVKTVENLSKKLNTKDVLESVNEIVIQNEKLISENFKALRENKMNEVFGPEKNGKEENFKRSTAELLVSKEIMTPAELDQKINEANENELVKKFSFAEADENSESNASGVIKKDKNESEFNSEDV